jgi:hypothetical protein
MKRGGKTARAPTRSRPARRVAAPKRARANTAAAAENDKLALLKRELDETRQMQSATAEILRVIAGSPGNLQPVFDAIVESAARLCEADNASLHRVEGDVLRHVATYGGVATLRLGETRPLARGSLSGHAIVARKIVQVRDPRANFPTAEKR